MTLLVFVYIAVAIFVIGNAYRIARIARMPAHLRWELYPMPRGTAEQRRHGGSYFEETEWWTKPRRSSRLAEFAYMLREVLAFSTVWRRNRPLWLWSWMMHVGLYALILTAALIAVSAMRVATWFMAIEAAALVSACAGLAGIAGLLARRVGDQRLRACTSRADVFNLVVIGAMFASGAFVHFSAEGTQEIISLTRALLRMNSAPALSWPSTLHVVTVAMFLVYFPATHMTHAFMKFFTYHRVRWDDAAVVRDSALGRAMQANAQRPISWAAPHIANVEKRTWASAVGRRSS